MSILEKIKPIGGSGSSIGPSDIGELIQLVNTQQTRIEKLEAALDEIANLPDYARRASSIAIKALLKEGEK